MALYIVIPTTEGVAQILGLVAEDPDVQSVVCLNNSTTTLAISSAYHQFVRKGSGLIHKTFGHGAYRLDVSCRIDQGNSWQLAVYLAHAALSKGQLGNAQLAAGDTLVWASGEVLSTGDVKPVEHLSEKMQHSQTLLQHARQSGVTILLLCAAQNANELSNLSAYPVTAVNHVDDAIRLLFPAKAASVVAHSAAQGHKVPVRFKLPSASGIKAPALFAALATMLLITWYFAARLVNSQTESVTTVASQQDVQAEVNTAPDNINDASKNQTLAIRVSLKVIGQSCQQVTTQGVNLVPATVQSLPGHRLCLISVAAIAPNSITVLPVRQPGAAINLSEQLDITYQNAHWQWAAPYPAVQQHYVVVVHPPQANLLAIKQRLANWPAQEQPFNTATLQPLQQQFSDWGLFGISLQGF